MYVEWKDEYSVGIEKFDIQHKKLCSLINELHASIIAGKGRESQKNVFKGLIEYSLNHFDDEERLMREHCYPELDSHTSEHREFRDRLAGFVEGYATGSTPFTLDLLSFMVEWLQRHLIGTDKKYEAFFKSKGVA